MNITFHTDDRIRSIMSNTRPEQTPKATDTPQKETAPAKASADFDKLTLQSKGETLDDESFASVTAKKATEAVAKGASAEKVEEIRAQVQTGTYRVDPNRIASHLLGYA